MPDQVALAEARQANEHHAADYERRLAAEIVAMLPDRDEARRVLAIAHAIMNLELPGEEPLPASAETRL